MRIGFPELIIIIAFVIAIVLVLRWLFRRSRSTKRPASPAPAAPMAPSKVHIHLKPERKRVQVAIEVVSVPSGVIIKVRRSRTVEHTIAVDWRTSGNIEAGIQTIVSASIRGEIERTLGRTYQQSETTEYEVELNGEKTNRYKLTWTDIWLAGESEMAEGNAIRKLSFEFRERSELEVSPLIENETVQSQGAG